jgi:DNA-binding transcriptional LysR family regulator
MSAPCKPDLKLLRVFCAVARNRGFALAQKELNLSTSAISTYMSELEQQLGFRLCERGRSGFSLTDKGALLLVETERLFGNIDALGRYAAALQGELSGTLRIGVIDATVTDDALPLPHAIGRFSQRHPAVHVDLSVRSPYELQQGLSEGRLDLAIGAFPSRTSSLLFQPLYREQQWLYCSDRHPLFAQRRIAENTIAELRAVRRSYWSENELGRHGFKQSVATVDSMEAQLILILSGAYVGFLPEHYAQPWVERQRLRVLLPSAFGYQSPSGREPAIQALRELLRTRPEKTD